MIITNKMGFSLYQLVFVKNTIILSLIGYVMHLEVKMGMERRGVRFLEDGRVDIAWPLVCR